MKKNSFFAVLFAVLLPAFAWAGEMRYEAEFVGITVRNNWLSGGGSPAKTETEVRVMGADLNRLNDEVMLGATRNLRIRKKKTFVSTEPYDRAKFYSVAMGYYPERPLKDGASFWDDVVGGKTNANLAYFRESARQAGIELTDDKSALEHFLSLEWRQNQNAFTARVGRVLVSYYDGAKALDFGAVRQIEAGEWILWNPVTQRPEVAGDCGNYIVEIVGAAPVSAPAPAAAIVEPAVAEPVAAPVAPVVAPSAPVAPAPAVLPPVVVRRDPPRAAPAPTEEEDDDDSLGIIVPVVIIGSAAVAGIIYALLQKKGGGDDSDDPPTVKPPDPPDPPDPPEPPHPPQRPTPPDDDHPPQRP